MFDSSALYKQRLSEHIKETSRYLKYMFNGHIAIALLFLISALAFYYQQWLAQMPDNFPSAWIIGIAFGLIATYSPIRTLLQEPDLVFLIVAEEKMTTYFRNSLIYSFVIQLYLVFLIVAALGPLYFAAYPERTGSAYLYTLIGLLLYKVWNLLSNWWTLKVRDHVIRHVSVWIRLILNCMTFYFLVSGNVLLASITVLLFVVVFLYQYMLSQKQAGVAWELLVEKDQRSMQAFYRVANLFTDVPHLRNRVKKRKWLVSLVNRVSFSSKYTYDYLYRITFIRSGDYLGMYVRLIIIGGLFIIYIPNLWMKLLFALLFLYLSVFQMKTLYDYHRTNSWLDIYPLHLEDKKRAFIQWIMRLGLGQAIFFAILFFFLQLYVGFTIALIGGCLFVYLFVYYFLGRNLT